MSLLATIGMSVYNAFSSGINSGRDWHIEIVNECEGGIPTDPEAYGPYDLPGKP